MKYQEFKPHIELQNYIACYWKIIDYAACLSLQKIIPDGCVDIIVNLGEAFNISSENFRAEHEQVILAGPMTKIKYTERAKFSSLIGIRFKPYGLHAFFKFDDLDNFRDLTVQLNAKEFVPDFTLLITDDLLSNLDKFFLKNLQRKQHYVQNIVHSLNYEEPLDILKIAAENHVTVRTLERNFLKYAGISLKSYYAIMRIQKAKSLLQDGKFKRLADIFYPLNFYDNAHFTREFARITGSTPHAMKNVV